MTPRTARHPATERTHGFYVEHVVPRLVNLTCAAKTADPLRRRVCAGLVGSVVDVGFGSGLNCAHYPAAVTAVAAVEPSDIAWRLAQQRLQGTRVPVERSARDAQALPYRDHTLDGAVSTWSLCTIPDPIAALQELRRVIKPGARLHFVEHGSAPDEDVRRWQRRLEPLQRKIFAGCHLTRSIVELLNSTGFVVQELDVFYGEGAPKFGGAYSLGIAVSP
ncbi:MAG TPA: class I SAM-dependent methyltransferase [Mycobacterium sp.]|nr:class I SAM-dependent methyltransferase [Mycobacterium sp.]